MWINTSKANGPIPDSEWSHELPTFAANTPRSDSEKSLNGTLSRKPSDIGSDTSKAGQLWQDAHENSPLRMLDDLSSGRKHLLLAIFSVARFVDICG